MEEQTPTAPKPIVKAVDAVKTAIGIKPAVSKTYDIFRIALVVGVLVMIYYSIKADCEDDLTLDDLTDVIEPGTAMYNTISEMNPSAQKKYLKSLKSALEDEPPR